MFLDESGLLTSPVVRRSWAPVGQTPMVYQKMNSRQKISAIAAIAVSPKRCKVRLFFSLRADENVHAEWVGAFLTDLAYHLGSRIVLVWDNLNVHKSRRLKTILQRRRFLRLAYLPPYAPELNPVEPLSSYLKAHKLANWAPHDIEQLRDAADDHMAILQNREDLLRSFIRSTPLSLRLK